jgi:hypothetical protein
MPMPLEHTPLQWTKDLAPSCYSRSFGKHLPDEVHRPKTFRVSLHTPAMLSREPLGLADGEALLCIDITKQDLMALAQPL